MCKRVLRGAVASIGIMLVTLTAAPGATACDLNCPAGDGGPTGAGAGDKSPDLNQDGAVNLSDIVLFQQMFLTTSYCADFDCDGIVTLTDYVMFALHYGHSGVPGQCI